MNREKKTHKPGRLVLFGNRHDDDRHQGNTGAEIEEDTHKLQDLLYSIDNIIQKSPDGIVIVDRAGVVLFANLAAEAFLDRKTEELIGQMFGFSVAAGETTELDGSELFRRIRQMDNHVPIAIITGYPDSDLMKKTMEEGPFVFMKKPFDSDDILGIVHSYAQTKITKV